MALGYVRVARPDDVVDIARIQLTTWQVAYRRLIPRTVLDQLNVEWLSEQWHGAVTAPPTPEHRVLMAIEQAERESVAEPAPAYRVGFAASGPADATTLAPDENHNALSDRVVAITELLVEPRWGRRGHGSRLLAASVDHWRTDGYETAVTWVFRDDVATVKFLTSTGWAPDGAARALDVDDLLVPQIRMRTEISAE
ncbi:N-acetyltransferase [Virgisporangium aliadipatigenens]|uniref:N-acetyltransferase n=1 Tax=Virgisporangium aliadipatigenens TaxID=741659 RepID=A0A8J4DR15_9ACTN|nr:GNAT family N-acetyltransferase [Virgisporangium aliadipatigenens]GIJ45882.1 N-acetyltransferase [Virgisporangium aliadipatigenens]